MADNNFSLISGYRLKPGFQKVLANPETHALTLLIVALDSYPQTTEEGRIACTEWTPHTLWRQLEEDYSVDLPQSNCDKLSLAVWLLTSNEFFKSLDAFIHACNVLSGDDAGIDFDPADCAEMAWGITEACLIHPPDEDEPFSSQIRYYIGRMLDEEEILNPPGILRLGIRKAQRKNTLEDFTDDPLLSKEIFTKTSDRSTEIDRVLRLNMQELIEELSQLRLAHGDTSDIVGKLRKAMQKK